MAIKRDITAGSARAGQSAAREAEQRRWSEVFARCRRDMLDAIRAGDHEGAWEIICDGPDVARDLRCDARARMSESLRSVARMNGWDEDGTMVVIGRKMAAFNRQFAQTAGSMVGRVA